MQVLKIQPQTLKSSYIKLITLLCSLVSSLIRTIIVTATPAGSLIPVIVVLVIFGVIYLITGIAYMVIRNVRKNCKCLKVVWLVDIAYIFSGLLYYVDSNFAIHPILPGMVVVFYRFIPFFISKYYQSNLAKEHQTIEAKLQLVPEWILAAESLTLLVEFDALYKITTPRSGCFFIVYVIGASVIWALFLLTYIAVLYYTMNIQYCGNYNVNISCVSSNLGAIVLVAAFGMHLLSNNDLPLACSSVNLRAAQIIMKILVLIVVNTVIVLLLVYRCLSKTRQEKLLPRALYQLLHPEPDVQNDLPLETVVRVGDEEKKQPDA